MGGGGEGVGRAQGDWLGLVVHHRQMAARRAALILNQGVDLGTRLGEKKKDSFRVLKRAVTVAITKEGSICKIHPPRLLITPEALCLHLW